MTPTRETYHYRGEVGLSWERYIAGIRLLVREYLGRLARGEQTRSVIQIRVMITEGSKTNVDILETEWEVAAILKEWCTFVSDLEAELGLAPFPRQAPRVDVLMQDGSQELKDYQLQRGLVLTFWKAFTFANTRVDEKYQLQPQVKAAFCPRPFEDLGVLWNGDVTLCCLDHDGQLKVGNVNAESIEAILTGAKATALRASMKGQGPLPPVCRTCQARPVAKT